MSTPEDRKRKREERLAALGVNLCCDEEPSQRDRTKNPPKPRYFKGFGKRDLGGYFGGKPPASAFNVVVDNASFEVLRHPDY